MAKYYSNSQINTGSAFVSVSPAPRGKICVNQASPDILFNRRGGQSFDFDIAEPAATK